MMLCFFSYNSFLPKLISYGVLDLKVEMWSDADKCDQQVPKAWEMSHHLSYNAWAAKERIKPRYDLIYAEGVGEKQHGGIFL